MMRPTFMVLALACGTAATSAAWAFPQEDPGDGLEELADSKGQLGGASRLSPQQIQAHAAAVAARAPDSVEAFRALEQRVMKTAARALPAVVGLLLAPDGQMGAGSGVIISADGWILTAGHVGAKPGVDVRVLLADGTELKGVTMGQHLDQDQDAGLVKVDTQGKALPFLPLGSSKNLSVGDPILVFGHPLGPELKPWRPPPLRVGHILALEGTVLAMDAPVTPGDSGGPVLDLDGRIVGVTSVASHRPDVNAAVTVDFVNSKLEALKQPQRTGAADPNGAAMVGLDDAFAPAAHQAQRARQQKVNEVLAPLVFTATDSVVTVMVDARAAALGVVVDDAGHILTKASEVGVGPRIVQVAMPDGQIVGAKRIAQDERLDLMLLATGVTDSDPIQFVDAELGFGAAVISVGQGMAPAAVGFRSLGAYDAGASDQASRSLIGVVLRPATTADRLPAPGVVVVEVMDGSGAKEAGLREGDGLLVVDGVALTSPDAPGAVLRQHAPGDTVQIEYVRGGVRKTASVRLQRPPIEMGPGNVGAALSRRATGFGPVIQHDGVVPAEAMGAPVVDSTGQVVGLNIARADRTKTYALSSATVSEALKRLLQAAAEGQSAEPPDLRTVLTPVAIRSDGRAVLSAGQARLYGPTITLQGEDDFQVIQGWASPEDVAVWVLDVPAPGRYEFHIDALGVVGGNVDLFVAGELFTVRIKPTPDETDFQASRAGESFFEEAGPVLVRVQPLDRPRGPIMNLREVRVSRMDVVRLLERMVPILRFRDMERVQRDWDREAQKARARKANEQTEVPK